MLRAHAVAAFSRGRGRGNRAGRSAAALLAAFASLLALAALAPGAFAAPPPVVTSVSPNSGPLDGGPTVTISGANFTAVKTVDFGTHEAAR